MRQRSIVSNHVVSPDRSHGAGVALGTPTLPRDAVEVGGRRSLKIQAQPARLSGRRAVESLILKPARQSLSDGPVGRVNLHVASIRPLNGPAE
jgi:hypothetical protein